MVEADAQEAAPGEPGQDVAPSTEDAQEHVPAVEPAAEPQGRASHAQHDENSAQHGVLRVYDVPTHLQSQNASQPLFLQPGSEPDGLLGGSQGAHGFALPVLTPPTLAMGLDPTLMFFPHAYLAPRPVVVEPPRRAAAKPEHEDSRAKRRGPMDEMRQLVRIMVKFLPHSLRLLSATDEPGGGNRVT